ncbi:PrsW family glutamic-type intramembrane protease [Levilactobacillus namurensis]|uniref:PrsW family glutamic-type intramembrane protease n=1 Tax=Levilactobacillus namurensis TaxID=380393 RepID=UPI000463742C|nr:PrsW family glutamic-type intramembrane protease [Levilactobacillus namurensis]
MKYCPNCGHPVAPTAKFCPACGHALPAAQQATSSIGTSANATGEPTGTASNQSASAQSQPGTQVPPRQHRESLYDNATSRLSHYTGEDGAVKVNLAAMFSQVLRHHSKSEAESIFIAGTETTTPTLDQISGDWAKPWLFSRILLGFLIAFVALLYMLVGLRNPNAIPGLILVGAFAVPFSGLVFFFEANAFKDVSLFEVVKIFFIGGIFSLIVTLFLYEFVSFSQTSQLTGMLTLGDSLSIGIVEELGKLLITSYFISRLNVQHILDGLLIGAAVGAGFAAFETAGYIYRAGGQLVDVAIIRGWSAVGGHLVWAAIAGGAIMVVKRTKPFQVSQLLDTRFLVFFLLAILFHAAWDWDIGLIGPYFKLLVLIVLAWIVVFVLMNAGLKEIGHLQQAAKREP